LQKKAVRLSARDIVGALPSAGERVMKGCRHNWMLENPESFARMVETWINDELPPHGDPHLKLGR
jgi:hypothetical protein